MCDYSLHLVASRPAKVGDKLVATDFVKSITGGFAAVGVAPCIAAESSEARNTAELRTSGGKLLMCCGLYRSSV
jgi:hypothetical protein